MKIINFFSRTLFAVAFLLSLQAWANEKDTFTIVEGADNNLKIIFIDGREAETFTVFNSPTWLQMKYQQTENLCFTPATQVQCVMNIPDNAFIVHPENVAATVIEAMGISRKRFSPVDPKISSLYHLVKK